MRVIIIFLTYLIFGFSGQSDTYKKYDIEYGTLIYSLQGSFMTNMTKPIFQKVYFSNYGATEFFEFVNEEDFPTFSILKIDSTEHLFVTDSMTISKTRGFDTVFEQLVSITDSKLSNQDLKITTVGDTIILGKNCILSQFEISHTGHKGKAALWNGIPLWVDSEWEPGLKEKLIVIELDLESPIPKEKMRIMEYVDK